MTTWGFAWLFVPMIGGIMLGAILSGRFAGRRSPQRTVRAGYALIFAGVALNLADVLGAAAGRRLECAPDLRLLHRHRRS